MRWALPPLDIPPRVELRITYWWRKLTNSPDTDSSLTLRVKTRADKTELELRDIIMQHSSARPSNSYALFSRASLFYLAVLIVGALECCVRVESIRAGRATNHSPERMLTPASQPPSTSRFPRSTSPRNSTTRWQPPGSEGSLGNSMTGQASGCLPESLS